MLILPARRHLVGLRVPALLGLGMAFGITVGAVHAGIGTGPQGTPTANAACNAVAAVAARYDSNAQLLRAELSGAAAVAAWQEGRHAIATGTAPAVTGLTSPFRSVAPGDPVAVCIYSGAFVAPLGPPPADGSVKQPYNRIRLLVRADGETVLDAVGHDNGDLKPETPGDWRP